MTFYAALMIGLLSSGHCLAMCGGLIATLNLGSSSNKISNQSLYSHNLMMNMGRTTTYMILGMLLAFVVSIIGYAVSIPQWSAVLRFMTGAAMVFAGAQIAFKPYISKLFGASGSCCAFAKIQNPLQSFDIQSKNFSSYFAGVVWGLIPCGMVYSIILIAASAGNVSDAAIVMFGFGLGTIPAMVLSGVAANSFKKVLKHHHFQKMAGMLFILMGLWFVLAPHYMPESLNAFSVAYASNVTDHPLMCH